MNKYLVGFLVLFFSAVASGTCTGVVTVNGSIGPATLDYLQRGFAHGRKMGCASHLLLINTPGGSLQTTRLLVEEIVNSPEPVLCLVHPAGGHAGSAGAIILQACHVNGAIEATNIGAATPVTSGGEDMGKDMRNKIINDTMSWIEGLVKLRKRSQEFARDIVQDAKAVDAGQALKLKAIDVVSKDIEQFLLFAQGREVEIAGGKKSVVAVGSVSNFNQDIRYKVLEMTTDPQFAYLIFMGSLGLLYFEVTHPGMIAPGVLGGIGLIVSLISFHKLEVDWAGLLLILLGLGLMVAEAFVPSFGALGVGGVVAFIFGSMLLYDPVKTGASLPLVIIVATASLLGAAMLGLASLAFSSRKLKRREGFDALVGSKAKIVKIGSEGREGLVEIQGELWSFVCKVNVALGDWVDITGHQGLTLSVEKVSAEKKN